MKKTRKAIPLTQRVIRKLLHQPQTLTGFEIAVAFETDASKGSTRGRRPRRFNVDMSSLPKRTGKK